MILYLIASKISRAGKKQLNSLITFLDKSGKESSAARSENTLRAVRLKREADDAGMPIVLLRCFPIYLSVPQTRSTERPSIIARRFG
jgi:hypothetical protein